MSEISAPELYTVRADGEDVKIMAFEDIKDSLISSQGSKIKDNNIFLGNGFNLSLGIKTGYKHLGEELAKIHEIISIIPDLPDRVAQKDFDLEVFISELDELEAINAARGRTGRIKCVEFIKREFFRLVLEEANANHGRKNKVMSFLADFKSIFTTNYDPVLYLLSISIANKRKKLLAEALRSMKNKKLPPVLVNTESSLGQGSLLEEIDLIRKGNILIDGEILAQINDFPEPTATGALHYLLSLRNKSGPGKISIDEIRQISGVSTESRQMFSITLDQLGISKHDGFYDRDGLIKWEEGEDQNLFYVHGSFHIYEDKVEELILKHTKEEAKTLHETLSRLNYSHMSVFQDKDKIGKIMDNDYLKHCYKKLKEMEGPLCIIGWQCAANDIHLADAIAGSPEKKIFVSVYSERGGKEDLFIEEAEKTVQNCFERLPIPRKRLIFFDIGTVDYLQ